MNNTGSLNPYGILQVDQEASEQEVRRSYRKLAKNCHPDKNSSPDSVFAFHQLTEALNCLVSPGLREQLDQEINRKKEKILRDRKLDNKELKLRRDLEERERKFFEEEENNKYDEERIHFLRSEAAKLLEEEHNSIANKLNRLEIREEKEEKPLIKIKWIKNTYDYSEESLLKIFSKYGEIENVVVRNRSGLIEFKCLESACIAFKAEKGFEENPLTLKPFFSLKTGSKNIFVKYPCMLSWPADIELALIQLEKFVFKKLLTLNSN